VCVNLFFVGSMPHWFINFLNNLNFRGRSKKEMEKFTGHIFERKKKLKIVVPEIRKKGLRCIWENGLIINR